MFIDPELAKSRVEDPNSLLNRLFPTPVPVPVPKDSESEEIPEVPSVPTSQELVSEGPQDEAISYLLGLRKAKEVPKESSVIHCNPNGKNKGDSELPLEAKVLFGTLNALGESQTSIANTFGISQPTVGNTRKGKKNGEEVSERIEKNLGKVTDKALDKLLFTIDAMEEDKIESLTPKEQANVAAQLSKVVQNMKPKAADINLQYANSQLIIYAPEPRTEATYEVIELPSN